jgi:hypothetical protein
MTASGGTALALAVAACVISAALACSNTPSGPTSVSTQYPAFDPPIVYVPPEPAFDGDVEGGLDAGESAFTCSQSADCASGQICCSDTEGMSTACQVGPCPYVQSWGMPLQLCGTAADCFVAGDVCLHPCITGPPFLVCFDPARGPCYVANIASEAGLDAGVDAGDAAIDAGTGEAAAAATGADAASE